ncbi:MULTISPECIES: hypothetical protein [unclassified Halomonas]|uniref:hypothetical protein n=1 Tax=unclassified Halomonas TaxID=2609666 RepID=UPI001CF26B11|nr:MULTISPECIES: hypothetical protein [unclassified Halomonas]MCA8865586.1 hypothetical protein [Halomonas sp. SBBP1]UZH10444.1 hypothetical protein OM794_01370 [Halomonas sp. BDJS001]
MIDQALNELKGFDFESANVHFWVFKTGQNARDKKIPRYTGRWVRTGPEIVQELKRIAISEVDRISEINEYTLLAQNNECSALHIPLELTHADIIISSCADEEEKNRIKRIKELRNNDLYIAKFVHMGEIIYGVKKNTSKLVY